MSPRIPLSELTGKIKAIVPSDREAGLYALYGAQRLFLARAGAAEATEIAALPGIQDFGHDLGDGRLEGKALEIALHFRHPWVAVTERFGVNAALVNLKTGAARELRREDYHCDVSSYSFGFVERAGRALYIAQTQWNRLDIFDAETGENLTEREVYCRRTGQKNEKGQPEYETKNYLDYFHSLLHVSPDGKHFLSNGWVWSPFDQVRLFDTEAFFKTFESGSVAADSSSGYNWDRPCAFVDGDLYVMAVDDARKTGNLDADEEPKYEYKPLAFFRVSDGYSENERGYRWVEPFRFAPCDAFPVDDSGEVSGRLYCDAGGHLVALTPSGAYALDLAGGTLEHLPDVTFTPGAAPGWGYSPAHRVFHAWRDGVGIVERAFADSGLKERTK